MSVSVADIDPASVTAPGSPRFTRRLLRRPVAVVCCAYLVAAIGVAIIAPIVWPGVGREHAGNLLASSHSPSAHHLLGTDTLGRDVLARLLVGSRVSLLGVAEALLVVLALGIPLGLAAGYLGGWTDRVVSWLADLTFSVPAIVIVIVVLSVFPENMLAGMCTLGVLSAPGFMRIVRSATLPVREETYIQAARVSGLSRPYILTRHVLPRIAGTVIVQASFFAATALIVQSGLAFLNLLVSSPAPSWGGMVADGTSVLLLHPWLIWPPGVAIAVTILAFCLLGDAVRDATIERWSTAAVRPPARAAPTSTAQRPVPSAGDLTLGAGALLSIEDLSVAFSAPGGASRVIEGVSFDVAAGETVGIVGESGCGKTVTTMAILGLLPGTGRVDVGRIWFGGQDLVKLPERQLRHIRGRAIALVSQEPMISLDPAFRVGAQLAEAVRHHLGVPRREARARAVELLASVHLPDPEVVARRYPHELSGGMAQRVAIARALAGEPQLLIADEPTTALDVTVQAEILDLLRELKTERNMALLLVTHDWGVVADSCDRVVVMYAGQVVEQSELVSMFRHPMHPYTKALLASNPHDALAVDMLPTIPGGVPQPGRWPAGCRFHPRCTYAIPACGELPVPIAELAAGRQTRCIRHQELADR
jgi:peptide/nickel transport system permease protein